MRNSHVERVVLIPNFGIGDLLMALPLVQKIKERLPRVRATVVAVGTVNHTLVRACPWIDDCIFVKDLSFLRKGHPQHPVYRELIGGRIRESDLAVCLVDTPFFRGVMAGAGATRGLFFSEEYLREGERLYGGFHRLVNDYFGWDERWVTFASPPISLGHEARVREWMERSGLGTRAAGVIVKGGDPAVAGLKDIPAETAARIIDVLVARGYLPCVILPPGADAALAATAAARGVPAAAFPDVRHAMALIRSLEVVVGPDTGLMHFAALAGVRVVSLFGHTSPVFYPTGASVTVIDKGGGCPQRCITGRPCLRHASTCLASVTSEELEQAIPAGDSVRSLR